MISYINIDNFTFILLKQTTAKHSITQIAQYTQKMNHMCFILNSNLKLFFVFTLYKHTGLVKTQPWLRVVVCSKITPVWI